MKFVIITIPDDPIVINATVRATVQSSGSVGSAERFVRTFVDADLSQSGSITFTHSFSDPLKFVDYSIFSPTLGEILPDGDSYEIGSLTVQLASYRPLVGLWTILIEA